ncbi:hypothetical protein VNI00_019168 [Paramarasmius palmivorus]|uniref:Uncharacterized protein n=1 Tax=Paramarasmius palmivorus TaxID=297713 RepID=A0AAW0AST1_9AGAR
MPSKSNTNTQRNVYRDRIPDPFDFEIIPSREEKVLVTGWTSIVNHSPAKGRSEWTRMQEWNTEEREDFALDQNGDAYEAILHGDICDDLWLDEPQDGGIAVNEQPAGRKRKRKSMRAKRPNIYWKENYRDKFVAELLRGKGRGDARQQKACTNCRKNDGVYRCQDCLSADLG